MQEEQELKALLAGHFRPLLVGAWCRKDDMTGLVGESLVAFARTSQYLHDRHLLLCAAYIH